jgi:hypothetical protein
MLKVRVHRFAVRDCLPRFGGHSQRSERLVPMSLPGEDSPHRLARRSRIAGPNRTARDEHRPLAGAPTADPGAYPDADILQPVSYGPRL